MSINKSVSPIKLTILFVPLQDSSIIFNHFADFIKLKRITALCFRFSVNCKNINTKCTGPISVTELSHATNILIKLAQEETYSDVSR